MSRPQQPESPRSDRAQGWPTGPAPTPSPAEGRKVSLRTRSVFADMLDLDLPADQRNVAETIFASGAPERDEQIGAQVTVAGPASTVFDHKPSHRSDAEAIRSFARTIEDRYRLRSELGRGGMATVYDAIDTDLRRHVAMKILQEPKRPASSPATSDDRSPLQRFIEEAQITGQLEHPNIVPVHEIGVDEKGRVYFTMKRVEGRSLREVMDDMRKGDLLTLERFDIFKLCDILRKVCDAIGFAHSRGVIHRDLKPDNVMVGRFGEVQVMDWGLAKVRTRPESDSRSTETFTDYISTEGDAIGTLDGTISGTPAYMPPEQARGMVSQIDERSDVFALGALLYEMITLVPPYHARSSRDALRRAQKYELRSPAESVTLLAERRRLPDDSHVHIDAISRSRKMPKELAAVAMRALAEQPDQRYQSVQDLDDEIERFLKNQPVTAYRDPPLKALAKWTGRHRVLSASAAAVFVMAMIGVLVVLALMKSSTDERLNAERDLLAKANEAKVEAEKRAALEQAQADRAEVRARALIPFSRGTDLVNRASASVDPETAYQLELDAKQAFTEAIEIDPDFENAFIWRGHTNEMLGQINDAIADLLHANEIRKKAGDPEDPASLVSAAMLAATRSLLVKRHSTLGTDFLEILKRARASAIPGSDYHELADIMVDWDAATKRGDYSTLLGELSDRMDALRERASTLWEVHLFSGVFTLLKVLQSGDLFSKREANETAKEHLKRAQRIRPQIPLVTFVLAQFSRVGATGLRRNTQASLRVWSEYIVRFPYDPLGYYGRASTLLFSEGEIGLEGDPEADLRRAIELDPELDEARELLPRALLWKGKEEAAVESYRAVIQSYDPADDLIAQDATRQVTLEGRFGRLDSTSMHNYLMLLASLERERTAQIASAIAELKRQCSEHPHVYRVYFHTLLRALMHGGHAADVTLLTQSYMPTPATAADYFDAAYCLACTGSFDAARTQIELCEAMLAQEQEEPDPLYALGGDPAASIEELRQRVDLLASFNDQPLGEFAGTSRILAARFLRAERQLSKEELRLYVNAVLEYPGFASHAELEMAVTALAKLDAAGELSGGMEARTAKALARNALLTLYYRFPHHAKQLHQQATVQEYLPVEDFLSEDAARRERQGDSDEASGDDEEASRRERFRDRRDSRRERE